MFFKRSATSFLRFAFHLFYNPFAFTYDPISALVSRGHWRDWTRAAIPHIVGTRVLEIPCGTGNLLLDLARAGYRPIGVDLSNTMLRISQGKVRAKHLPQVSLRAERSNLSNRDMETPALQRTQCGASVASSHKTLLAMTPPLVRARAQAMPFASAAFDSIVMTFPPSFVFDPDALAELRRILDANGRLIWVDAGRLLPHDAWSRALNAALNATGGEGNFERVASEALGRAGFESRVETVRDEESVVCVVIATKSSEQ